MTGGADLSGLIQFDGLQQVLSELVEARRLQAAVIEQLRADNDARWAKVERRLDAIDAALGSKATEREVRRVEADARQARDVLARQADELASRVGTMSEAADAREAARTLAVSELQAELQNLAPLRELKRVEAAVGERVSVDQLHAARAALEASQRAASDVARSRAAELSESLGAHATLLADHAQQLPRLATTEAVERLQRAHAASTAQLEAAISTVGSEARSHSTATDRRVERSAEDARAEREQVWAALRRVEADVQGKMGREEAVAQIDELTRVSTASQRAAEADTRAATTELARRVEATAAIAERAADAADAASASAAERASRADFSQLETRVLALASRDELRAEVERMRAELDARARTLAERLELHESELSALGAAALGVGGALGRGGAGSARRAPPRGQAAAGDTVAEPASARDAEGPAGLLATPSVLPAGSGGGSSAPTRDAGRAGGGAGGGAFAFPDSGARALDPARVVDAGVVESAGLRGATSEGSVPSGVPAGARAPGSGGGEGGHVTTRALGGAFDSAGLRSDLERRRQQLEQRRQSIAEARMRSAAGM